MPPSKDRSKKARRSATPKGKALERKLLELRALVDITAGVNSGFALDETLDEAYRAFKPLIPYDRLGCALIDAAGTRVSSIWARSVVDRLEIAPGYSAPLQGSSLARVAASGEPRILNDLQQYLLDHPKSDSTRRIVEEGVRSSLTCPLAVEGKAAGFLFFSSRKPGTYARVHATTYREIATQVAVIVERARIYEDLVETRRRLFEANRRLEQAVHTDGLTGAWNRRFFDLVLDREWKRALRFSEQLSVAVVDVDDFKQYNDAYGHPAGDECLKRVAAVLGSSAKRGTDLVARVGGEEFVVLLPHTGADAALNLAEDMRRRVEELQLPHRSARAAARVTISVGVAGGVPTKEGSPAETMRAVDAALSRAKEAGRNRVCAGEWPASARAHPPGSSDGKP